MEILTPAKLETVITKLHRQTVDWQNHDIDNGLLETKRQCMNIDSNTILMDLYYKYNIVLYFDSRPTYATGSIQIYPPPHPHTNSPTIQFSDEDHLVG